LVIVGAFIAAHFALGVSPADRGADARKEASLEDQHRPHLRLIVDDVLRVRGLLLKGRDIPGGGFHPYHPYDTPLPSFTGTCGALADPNLSALTATADVSGRVVANVNSGAEFLPSGYVFRSPAEAARAQALETEPDYVPCEVALIKQRFEGSPFSTTGLQRRHVISRDIDGVTVRGQQVVVTLKYKDIRESIETSFIFFRHGRGLFELRTSTPWGGKYVNGAVEHREWTDAIDATVRHLKRSGF
jgi:hypothetical protein